MFGRQKDWPWKSMARTFAKVTPRQTPRKAAGSA